MALVPTSEAVASQLQLNGQEYCFVRVQDRSRFTVVDPNGQIICGSYSHRGERVRPGPRLIRLHTLMYPTPGEWDTLLPLIGYQEDNDVFTPKDSLTVFNAQVKYDLGGTGNYRVGKVDRAIARGQQGLAPVSLELHMVFQDFDMDSAFSATDAAHNFAYEFTSGTLAVGTTGDTTRRFNSFVWAHDNHLRSRFNNQVTTTNIANTERTVHLGVNTPFTTAEDDLLTDAINDTTRISGQQGQLAFTVGSNSLTFAFNQLVWEAAPPSIPGKSSEVRLQQFYKAYENESGPENTITNVLAA